MDERREVQRGIIISLADGLYWKERAYSDARTKEIYSASLPGSYMALVDYPYGAGFTFQMKKFPPNPSVRNLLGLISLIREQTLDLAGSFLVSIGDGIHPPIVSGGPSDEVPMFCFSKLVSDPLSTLLPDPDFLGSNGEADTQAFCTQAEKLCPWEKKQPIVFWRGSTTGYYFDEESWSKNVRVRLVSQSKTLNLPVDVYFSSISQIEDPKLESLFLKADLVRNKIEFKEFYKYKYLVEVDGNSCPWSFLRKLRMKSLVFRVESPYMQWYYPLLKPWVHYVPVASDLNDFGTVIEWAITNDSQAKEIAERGSALAEFIDMEFGQKYSWMAITKAIRGCNLNV